jgi:hypothetical protein
VNCDTSGFVFPLIEQIMKIGTLSLHFSMTFAFLTGVKAWVPPPSSIVRCPTINVGVGGGSTTGTQIYSSSPTSKQQSQQSSETEAERLLRKARELRAAAARDEQQVHGDLTQKKDQKDAQTDAYIDQLFFDPSNSNSVVDTLRKKRWSQTTLERIVLRLDERLVRAQGWDHVEGKVNADGKAEFVRVKDNPDPATVERLDGKIEILLDAVEVLDEEFRKAKKQQQGVAHAEQEHWGGGYCAVYLRDRINSVRRERSEHFQKRLKEVQDAQRRKDDHKFDGYHDLGTLN